jgi:hypothetical protein
MTGKRADDHCPDWYAQAEQAAFCEYLEHEYGIR